VERPRDEGQPVMPFREYLDGERRVMLRVEHHVSLRDMAMAIASNHVVEAMDDNLPTMTKVQVIKETRDLLAMKGWDGIDFAADEWGEGEDGERLEQWAWDEVTRLFPEGVSTS
jgi:hypothetical protein